MGLIKNLEQKVKLAKFVAIGSFFTSIIICIISFYFAGIQVSESRKSIYVLSNNIPIMADQTDQTVNRPAEYKSQIDLFHSLFFNITPDEKFIERNIKKAMYLVDESGMQQYSALKERGYYSQILSSNAFVTLFTDSIALDMEEKSFTYYGKQKIERKSSVLIRSLITTGKLRDIPRSDNNSHGAILINWKTIENRNLDVQDKMQL